MSDAPRRTLAPVPRIALTGGVALVILVAPYFTDSATLRLLTTAALYAYLAQCWNLVGGYGGMFSLGHPVFFATGAYTSALLVIHASVTPWLAWLAGAAIAAALAVALTLLTVRFKVGGVYFALLTLAAWTVTLAVVSVSDVLGRANGLLLPLGLSVSQFNFEDPYWYYAVIAVLAMLLTVGVWVLSQSPFGRALVAQREDPLAAQASGVSITRVRSVAMAASAAATALGGSFAVHYYNFASPGTVLSFDVTLQMLLGTLVGGAGTVLGPILGGTLFTVLAEALRSVPALSDGSRGAVFTTMVYAVVLICTALLAPKGLLPAVTGALARRRPRRPTPQEDIRHAAASTAPVRPRTQASPDGPALLEVVDVSKRIGGLQILQDVSLTVGHGEIVGLIGPNGAGKTTLFNCVSGFMRPTSGVVRLRGEDVTQLEPFQLCRRGMGRTFQITKPFPEMTVLETVQLALEQSGVPSSGTSAMSVLELVRFSADVHELGGNLSVVNRKRLEVARALAGQPDLLLLDEVCAGLAPHEVDEIVEVLRSIAQQGVAMLMVEHVLAAVFKLSSNVVVLSQGRVVAAGSPQHVMRDEGVITAYLGSAARRMSLSLPDAGVQPASGPGSEQTPHPTASW